MTDVTTADLLQTLMADGAHNNTWGDVNNTNLLTIETKLVGRTAFTLAGGEVDLTNTQELVLLIDCSGVLGSASSIVFSGRKGFWIINNKTTGAFSLTAKVTGQTGVQIAQNTAAIVYCDGTDIRLGNVVATVTTTQGDLIVRGASADGRLGIGTANQVLQVNAGATSPAWATLSTLLDTLFGSTQNYVLSRGAAVWSAGTVSSLLDTVLGNAANSLAARGASTWSQSTLTSLLDTLFSSTQGATLYRGATGWAGLAPGTAGQLLQSGGAAANPSWLTRNVAPDVILEEQETAGTNGQTLTALAVNTRILNQKPRDALAICTLAANQFTLPAGTYYFEWGAQSQLTNSDQTFLYNVTGAAELKRGGSQVNNNNNSHAEWSQGRHVATFGGNTTIELRHDVQSTRTNAGGLAGGFGTEIYAFVLIWKIA